MGPARDPGGGLRHPECVRSRLSDVDFGLNPIPIFTCQVRCGASDRLARHGCEVVDGLAGPEAARPGLSGGLT